MGSINSYDLATGNLNEIVGSVEDNIYVSKTTIMPTPIADLVGAHRLYVGPSNSLYKKGTIYECAQETSDPSVYVWVPISCSHIVPGDGIAVDGNEVSVIDRLKLINELPEAEASREGETYLYLGESGRYIKGTIYQCQETETDTYTWVAISAQPEEPEDPVQVTTMPEADVTELGNVYQYIGDTTVDFTHGYFYECVANGTDPETYSWSRTNVQPQQTGALQMVTSLPAAVAELVGDRKLYVGVDDGDLKHGGVYECQGEEVSGSTVYKWVCINDIGTGDSKIFPGTFEEWDELTPEEQAQYDFIATPDEAVEDIADAVINGDMRAVTSNAVADELNPIKAKIPSDTSANNKLVNDSRLKSFRLHGYWGTDGDVTFNLSDYGCEVGQYYGFRITCLTYGAWGNFEIVFTNNGANNLIKVYEVKAAPTGITIGGVWSGDTLTGIIIEGASATVNTYNLRFEVIG